MKLSNKYLSALITAFLLKTLMISADDQDGFVDFRDNSAEQIQQKTDNGPFKAKAKVDIIQKTKIKEGYYEDDEVQFSEGNLEFSTIFYYCEAYKEGAQAAISYTATHIGWQNNPWLEQDRFYTGTFSLSAITHRLRSWIWRGQVAINVDTQEWNFNDYATYDLLLWGRYEYCKHIGLHVGLIVETGMLMDRVYPILGADWQISKKWRLNLVFPVNVSLDYVLTKHWAVALAARNFNSRFRANQNEGQSKALIRYQNLGAEIAFKYEKDNLTANIHAGSTLGGQLRLADRHNHHPHHYRFDPAAYVGAEVDLKF